jgi:hypothetical protein
MYTLDQILLWSLFAIQVTFAIALIRSGAWKTFPVFTAYLCVGAASFVPWSQYGANWGYLGGFPIWSAFISVFKVAVSIEAAFRITEGAIPASRKWQRSFTICVALLLLFVLALVKPISYPDYPKLAYYIRISGHFSAMFLAGVAKLYCWSENEDCPGWIQQHATILMVYFGGMLVASQVYGTDEIKTLTHCFLMAVHIVCFVAWYRLITPGALSTWRYREFGLLHR